MPELSIIVPFCLEFPTVVFTLQSIAQELKNRVDFEVIAVDNFCNEVAQQSGGKQPDRASEQLPAVQRGNPWLKALKYETKLSHWQAKNLGVQHSSGKFLLFIDAHCVVSRDSIFNMLQYYREHHEQMDGTLHLPLTYHILEWHSLIYKLVDNREAGEVHYSFTGFRDSPEPYEVPCMSTCGMMMSRKLYDLLGGWPVELGIYGGGENFMNFVLAILGKTKWIMPGQPLFHHGEKRGYHWTGDDYTRNRTIATYMFGGEPWAKRFIDHRRGSKEVLYRILNDVIDSCGQHRKQIEQYQQMSIEDWLHKWSGKEG
jgi:glycosyltransferase involved in cell wall biosynthesis